MISQKQVSQIVLDIKHYLIEVHGLDEFVIFIECNEQVEVLPPDETQVVLSNVGEKAMKKLTPHMERFPTLFFETILKAQEEIPTVNYFGPNTSIA
jgi:hypothetical protein